MTNLIVNFGYLGLAAFCFFAATILPVSSETALATALALKLPALPALAFATIGNCAGVACNYWVGSKVEAKVLHQHLQKKESIAMPKLKCEKCGQQQEVPQHCGQPMHIEKVKDVEMLVCWMGPECGKQNIPVHCGAPMVMQT